MRIMATRPLPPLTVPWTMKPLDSADRSIDELDDGRLRFSLVHEIIEGVTPRMLVWWFKHLDGDVDVDGQTMSRYRAWHPIDHVRVTYVTRAENGDAMGPGSKVHIEEFFGARPEYKIDIIDEVIGPLQPVSLRLPSAPAAGAPKRLRASDRMRALYR